MLNATTVHNYKIHDQEVHGSLTDCLTDEFWVWRFAPLSIRLFIRNSRRETRKLKPLDIFNRDHMNAMGKPNQFIAGE